MEINKVFTFLMVLSTIYTLRFIIEFLMKLFAEEPTVMKLSNVEKTLLYLSLSYIITFIIV